MDLSCLSMLKDLILDDNPIVSLPNCLRSLPRLESLSMRYCKMLKSVEHPPHTLRFLDLYIYDEPMLQKVSFDPEMSPLELSIRWAALSPLMFEIEGMVKIQPMGGVEEKVLRNLGWTELHFLKEWRLETDILSREKGESEIQMYYEFGIFSTIYRGQEMPNWITGRSKGPSISFTIASSPKNLTGLNFCYVWMPWDIEFQYVPMIRISNITKNRTWIYNHYVYRVNVAGDCVIFLSHWMFGMNEMEGGDQVVVTLDIQLIKECGVSFVYDDGDTHEEEEEDVLGYYKSWNHIIGKDLSAFQLMTGDYFLNIWRFTLPGVDSILQSRRVLFGEGARFKDKQVPFRAFSQRKSGVRLLEDGP